MILCNNLENYLVEYSMKCVRYSSIMQKQLFLAQMFKLMYCTCKGVKFNYDNLVNLISSVCNTLGVEQITLADSVIGGGPPSYDEILELIPPVIEYVYTSDTVLLGIVNGCKRIHDSKVNLKEVLMRSTVFLSTESKTNQRYLVSHIGDRVYVNPTLKAIALMEIYNWNLLEFTDVLRLGVSNYISGDYIKYIEEHSNMKIVIDEFCKSKHSHDMIVIYFLSEGILNLPYFILPFDLGEMCIIQEANYLAGNLSLPSLVQFMFRVGSVESYTQLSYYSLCNIFNKTNLLPSNNRLQVLAKDSVDVGEIKEVTNNSLPYYLNPRLVVEYFMECSRYTYSGTTRFKTFVDSASKVFRNTNISSFRVVPYLSESLVQNCKMFVVRALDVLKSIAVGYLYSVDPEYMDSLAYSSQDLYSFWDSGRVTSSESIEVLAKLIVTLSNTDVGNSRKDFMWIVMDLCHHLYRNKWLILKMALHRIGGTRIELFDEGRSPFGAWFTIGFDNDFETLVYMPYEGSECTRQYSYSIVPPQTSGELRKQRELCDLMDYLFNTEKGYEGSEVRGNEIIVMDKQCLTALTPDSLIAVEFKDCGDGISLGVGKVFNYITSISDNGDGSISVNGKPYKVTYSETDSGKVVTLSTLGVGNTVSSLGVTELF